MVHVPADDRRVNLHFPMIFLWFSQVPMVFWLVLREVMELFTTSSPPTPREATHRPPRRMVPIAQAGYEAQHRRDGRGEGQACQGFGQILSWLSAMAMAPMPCLNRFSPWRNFRGKYWKQYGDDVYDCRSFYICDVEQRWTGKSHRNILQGNINEFFDDMLDPTTSVIDQ